MIGITFLLFESSSSQLLHITTNQYTNSNAIVVLALHKKAPTLVEARDSLSSAKGQHVQQQTPLNAPTTVINQNQIQETKKIAAKSEKKVVQEKKLITQAKKEEAPISKKNALTSKKIAQNQMQTASKKEIKPQEQQKVQNVQEKVYMGRDEYAAYQLQQFLQEQIDRCWSPPVGTSSDLVCTMKVAIGKEGIIQLIDTEESSRVLIYDIAARNALSEIKFPKQLWGKEIRITFKR